MKILIINPPFYRLQRASLVHYPAACCYIAATLEQAGFDSLIYNADYDPNKKTILGNTNHINIGSLTGFPQEYLRRLHDDNDPIWKEISGHIVNYGPGVLIISIFSTTISAGNKIAKIAKAINPKVITVFEGSTNRGLHCAVDPSINVDAAVMDFAIRKEPEYTAVELIKAIAGNTRDFSAIKGLSWKRNGQAMIHNEDRPYLKNIDALPFPARHLLDGYENMPPHAFQGIYGSRGCPFDCIFCGCHTSWGYEPRLRSAKNMVDEIEYVYKRHGTRYFYICDDIFFIQKTRAHEFCGLLCERKIPVYWSAQTRAEMVDDETLAMMKKSGGQHVAVGVEVGNPEVRKLIKKGNTIDDVRNCARMIKKHGLYMVAFCMIGLPWEGPKEITDTVNLIKEISPFIVYPYMPTPAAGTELADMLVAKNPSGLAEYRDCCHIDPSQALSENILTGKKKKVIEWAMEEFERINKKSLLKNIFERPKFYWALAHDMDFFRHPKFFLNYLGDYAAQ